jgi:hypothetical protein
VTSTVALFVLLGLSTTGGDIQPRTRVVLRLESLVSTKTARVGDPVRLSTASTIVVDGMSIPRGSDARGVVARAKRPGRIRGLGELEIRVVSITRPDGTVLPVNANAPSIETPRRGPLPPGSRLPPPTVPIIAGMVAGYGTAALVSRTTDSGDAIVKSGVAAGLATGIMVGVLKRGEDLVLLPGHMIDVVF